MLVQKITGALMLLFAVVITASTHCGTPALFLTLAGVGLLTAKENYLEFVRSDEQ